MTPEDLAGTRSESEPKAPTAPSEWMFGQEFIRQVLYWSIAVAAVGGVIGWLVTAEMAFGVGLWLGAAIDIATFRYLAFRGLQPFEQGTSHSLPATVLIIRYAAKGLLLVVAAVLAPTSAFWGVLAGVLVVEFMLVVVGIFRSATDVFGTRSKQGPGVQS